MHPQSCNVLVDRGIKTTIIPDWIFDQPNIWQRIAIRQKAIPSPPIVSIVS
jgi:hypothetical protein